MSYYVMTPQLRSFLRLCHNYIITFIFLNCPTRVVLVYWTGIFGYWSGNTPCWSGNIIYISRNDYTCRVLWSILPVPAIVSTISIYNQVLFLGTQHFFSVLIIILHMPHGSILLIAFNFLIQSVSYVHF